jgi:hypothetical protein
MDKLKFNKNETISIGKLSYISNDIYKLEIENITEDIALSGFYLLNENNDEIMGDYSKFTTKYKSTDEDNTYYISTGVVYTEPEKKEPEKEPEKVLTEEEIAEKKKLVLKFTKNNKIFEMSNACEAAIENGVEVNGKHYSYTAQDQSNMLNAMNLAKETGMEVPYHADGESCGLYNYDAISAIYIQETMNLTTNQTYFNQLKLYILSISDVDKTDDIAAIKYGDKLTGEYLDKYNEIMNQSKKIVEKVVTLNA